MASRPVPGGCIGGDAAGGWHGHDDCADGGHRQP